MFLVSCRVNYLHEGATKVWFGVPAEEEQRTLFEKTLHGLETARHKSGGSPQKPKKGWVYERLYFTRPEMLEQHGVRCCRLEQEPGDLIVTMPGAYHAGYSKGAPKAAPPRLPRRVPSLGTEPKCSLRPRGCWARLLGKASVSRVEQMHDCRRESLSQWRDH